MSCLKTTASIKTSSVIMMIRVMVQAIVKESIQGISKCIQNSQLPKLFGTAIIRTVLSALPDINSDASGLNRKVVGGKSCAFKIVKTGYT